MLLVAGDKQIPGDVDDQSWPKLLGVTLSKVIKPKWQLSSEVTNPDRCNLLLVTNKFIGDTGDQSQPKLLVVTLSKITKPKWQQQIIYASIGYPPNMTAPGQYCVGSDRSNLMCG